MPYLPVAFPWIWHLALALALALAFGIWHWHWHWHWIGTGLLMGEFWLLLLVVGTGTQDNARPLDPKPDSAVHSRPNQTMLHNQASKPRFRVKHTGTGTGMLYLIPVPVPGQNQTELWPRIQRTGTCMMYLHYDFRLSSIETRLVGLRLSSGSLLRVAF